MNFGKVLLWKRIKVSNDHETSAWASCIHYVHDVVKMLSQFFIISVWWVIRAYYRQVGNVSRHALWHDRYPDCLFFGIFQGLVLNSLERYFVACENTYALPFVWLRFFRSIVYPSMCNDSFGVSSINHDSVKTAISPDLLFRSIAT